MIKIRSPRWLRGATRIALGIAALSACSPRFDVADGGTGGTTGSAGHGGSAATTGASGSGMGSTGTGGPGAGGTGAGGSGAGGSGIGTSGGPGPSSSAGEGGSGGDGGSSSSGGDGGSSSSGGDGGSSSSGGDGGSDGGSGGSSGTSTGAGGAPSIDKFVGNITAYGDLRDDFAKYWNQITPEVEGRWSSVEPTRGNRIWSRLDAVYQYAQDHDIPFMQYAFVWGGAQPSWHGGLSSEQMRDAVRGWMQAFCQRYPDTKYIVVVNEPPPHTTPPFKNAIGGDGASGYDWIVNSFKWAREFCPNAILILNDYNIIEYASDHNNMLKIVNAVKSAGGPIDAIGAEAHDAWRIDTSTVKGYIDGLAATGLPVYITEYDIPIEDDERQRQVMEEQFPMFYDHGAVHGITLWGYVVGSTWRQGTGLIRKDGTMRPAMAWLMDYLGRSP